MGLIISMFFLHPHYKDLLGKCIIHALYWCLNSSDIVKISCILGILSCCSSPCVIYEARLADNHIISRSTTGYEQKLYGSIPTYHHVTLQYYVYKTVINITHATKAMQCRGNHLLRYMARTILINTFRSRQNGHLFANDNSQFIFFQRDSLHFRRTREKVSTWTNVDSRQTPKSETKVIDGWYFIRGSVVV